MAGIFSGLFGVGGGTIIVPLLIFWFGYGERLATGTSLGAIVLIGLLGALAQGGIYGNVHVATGLALTAPAILGVVLGTAIQARDQPRRDRPDRAPRRPRAGGDLRQRPRRHRSGADRSRDPRRRPRHRDPSSGPASARSS